MAKSVTTAGSLTSKATFTNDTPTLGPTTQSVVFTLASGLVFANGSGASQVNCVWTASGTIAAAGTVDYDLAGGITDAFGDAITFTSIKLMCIENLSATATMLVGDAAAPFASWITDPTDTVIIAPSSCLFLVNPTAAGYAVTATTGDTLRLAYPAAGPPATLAYNIVLWGVR